MRKTTLAALTLGSLCLGMMVPRPLCAAGARLYKSGPIQITADGSTVWAVNPDNDSVARIDTATEAVLEIPLPDPGQRHAPQGLAVLDDGSEVWVACHDSDRVYVLRGSDGAVLARIDLPWGTGPYSIALPPPSGVPPVQPYALVTGFRGARLAVLEVASHSLREIVEPVFQTPYGLTFTDDGSAWVTHLFADGEHPRLTRIDVSDPDALRVTTKSRVFPAQPQSSGSTAPRPAEGGYATLRGHPAQVPAGQDLGRVWLPIQYQNLHDDAPSPDATVQSTIRKLDLASRQIGLGSNLPSEPGYPIKVVLTAVDVHDPVAGGGVPVYDGPGWNAAVSGPVDLAFAADGLTAYVLHEQSEDVLVVPTDTPPVRPAAAPPLVEIPVGRRPMGIVASPTTDRAYVLNVLSRTVSVLDLTAGSVLRELTVTPLTGEPLSPTLLRGASLFHTSNEDAVSRNRKVACASCHLNGEHDGRTWDLQHLPGNHGPRQTQTLAGLAATFGAVDPATGWGQLHRSGDRDEVQDFEHTLQGLQMGGDGFLGAGVHPELGTPNAGRSADLDALAAYVLALPAPPRSPYRQSDGALREAAVRGATFFTGTDPVRPADALCATCHPPASGFSDRRFHDVGQLQLPGENELNNRVPVRHVNTPGLTGLWMTPPYEGASIFTETLAQALLDYQQRGAGPAAHGRLDNLTGRQMRDLATFLLSLDGTTTAAEVTTAVDTTPPRVITVAPTSLTRLEAWLSESVDAASATNPAAWRLTDTASGQEVAITGAQLEARNGDRVTLTVASLAGGCPPRAYALQALGPIHDLAAQASGGTTNTLTNGPPVAFTVSETLTITLGASGYENLTVPVHDAATLPGLTTWSHGSLWLLPTASQPSTGLLRFDWGDAFRTATGITAGSNILDARITLHPDLGDAQAIEARRVLQAWFDHHGPDFTSNPVDPTSGHGGPTWLQSEHGVRDWNSPNAQASTPGVEGDAVGDYFAAHDTAFTPDATVVMPAFNQPAELAGPQVTAAFRFWLDHPATDQGYALRILPGAVHDVRFESSEHDFQLEGPVLRITYQLPVTCGGIFADSFASGDTSAWSTTVP